MAYRDDIIEQLLLPYRQRIGADYEGYRNHVYRVYLNCLLMDCSKANQEKYAIAAVFHDIGIWTHHTVDYLRPSIQEAAAYLAATGRRHLTAEIAQMICWHHKITPYRGAYRFVVNTFRKADWIDVSLGLLSLGACRQAIRANRSLLPNAGFHYMLLKKIAKNLLRHPANPLPMFRR